MSLIAEESGSQRGDPWSPGALKFLLWSPEPYHFTDWSPDPFLAVEPGAQRHFARNPEPSIFKFDHSSSQIALILDYCLFVFVRINGHKETESEERTVHNTRLSQFTMICNNLVKDLRWPNTVFTRASQIL